MKSLSVTIQIKATEQYFTVVLLLRRESLDGILKSDYFK